MSSYYQDDQAHDKKRKSFKSSGCFNCGEMGHFARECSQPNRKRNRRHRSSSRSPEHDSQKRYRQENSYSRRRSTSKSPSSRRRSEKYSHNERRKPYASQGREFRRSRSRSRGLDSQGSSSASSTSYTDSPRYDNDQRMNYQSRKSYGDPRRRAQGLYNQYFPSGRANDDSLNSQYPPQYSSGSSYEYPPQYSRGPSYQNNTPQYTNSGKRDREFSSENSANHTNSVNEEESWDDGPTTSSNCSEQKKTYNTVSNNKQEPIGNKSERHDTNTEEEESWD